MLSEAGSVGLVRLLVVVASRDSRGADGGNRTSQQSESEPG